MKVDSGLVCGEVKARTCTSPQPQPQPSHNLKTEEDDWFESDMQSGCHT